MNKEGYKTLTEDAAVGREYMRELLGKKYNIKEGDVIRMELECGYEVGTSVPQKKIVEVRVWEIHKHFVTVILPKGYSESFQWREFNNRRR